MTQQVDSGSPDPDKQEVQQPTDTQVDPQVDPQSAAAAGTDPAQQPQDDLEQKSESELRALLLQQKGVGSERFAMAKEEMISYLRNPQ